MYQRDQAAILRRRFAEPRRFIQVLLGPRQVGKTTVAQQLAEDFGSQARYVSADEPGTKDSHWLEQQWEIARALCRREGAPRPALLILDEAQKLPAWSETVKRLWDEDSAGATPLHLLLLGSSALLVQRGLSESLAGRFEMIPITHWSFAEMRAAFDFDLEHFLLFGGYPGAAALCADPPRWASYVRDALIEPTLARDLLLMTRIDKPALLRRLFELACLHSGQVISYQKLLGQLHDAGNTTTLAHYLDLLGKAGLVTGLQKDSGGAPRRRASSPKLIVLNTALMTASAGLSAFSGPERADARGRLVESAIGAWLVGAGSLDGIATRYWASGNREVDFVLSRGDEAVAIEVKSGRRRAGVSGLASLAGQRTLARKLLVGSGGIPIEEFLQTPPSAWFS